MQVPIGVSNRHIHLSKADAEALFGEGYELTPIKDLSQPGQYAANECVTLKGPKGQIEKVRILGPYRPQTQVEILVADQFKLGSLAPIRLSGDLRHSAGIDIIGPDGTKISINEGMIIAKRHIHMTPADAEKFGVQNNQIVQIRYGGERGLTFDEVVVRVTESSRLDTHIDVEEANAAAIPQASSVELLPSDTVRMYTSNNQVYA